MQIRPLALDGVIEIVPRKFGDARGFFSETFSKQGFREAGIDIDWVQDNQSFSAEQGVLRGLLQARRPPTEPIASRVLLEPSPARESAPEPIP